MTSPSEAVIEEEEKRLKMKCEKQEYVWDCDQQMKQAVHSTGRATEGNGALPHTEECTQTQGLEGNPCLMERMGEHRCGAERGVRGQRSKMSWDRGAKRVPSC